MIFQAFLFSFPITFRLSQLTATREEDFKSMNSSGLFYHYFSTPIFKLFLVSELLFCSLPIKSYCHECCELSLATTITVFTFVSCDHVKSFNYDDRKARDVGLTWYHLSDTMSDSIFQGKHEAGITCFLFVCLFVSFVCFSLFLLFCLFVCYLFLLFYLTLLFFLG